MTDSSFITNLKSKTDLFVQALIKNKESGKSYTDSFKFNLFTLYFFLDMSNKTSRNENNSSTVAVINTFDSNITIILTLEVRITKSTKH